MEITTPAYQLPYPATEFEALLILANNANKLSITAESHAQMSIMLYDEVYDKILPQLADDKTLIFQSVKTAGTNHDFNSGIRSFGKKIRA